MALMDFPFGSTRQLYLLLYSQQHFIEYLVFAIFGPIFFVNLGRNLTFDLSIVVEVLSTVFILYTALLFYGCTQPVLLHVSQTIINGMKA